jgi:hypothetical protein
VDSYCIHKRSDQEQIRFTWSERLESSNV